MKTFEFTRFPERIISTGGLADMVRCTESLPEAATMPVGTIYHLTDPQIDYRVNHIYMCVVNVISGLKSWKDITENSDIRPTGDECFAIGNLVEWDSVLVRLNAIWNTPNDPTNDQWVRDILVRKLDGKPASILDGEIITASSTRNQYETYENTYQSGSITEDPYEHTYMYRVFHVFASGAMSYTEMVTTELAGYAAKCTFCRTMDDTFVENNVDTGLIWRQAAFITSETWVNDIIYINNVEVFNTKTGTYKTKEGSVYKATRLNRTLTGTEKITMKSYYKSGMCVTADFKIIDQWAYLKRLSSAKMLATGIIGNAHTYSPGQSFNEEYMTTGEYVFSTATDNVNHRIWTQELGESSILLRAVWSSVGTNATEGKPEYKRELIKVHWPKECPNTSLQEVAEPTYIGPIIPSQNSTIDNPANPTICDFIIQ